MVAGTVSAPGERQGGCSTSATAPPGESAPHSRLPAIDASSGNSGYRGSGKGGGGLTASPKGAYTAASPSSPPRLSRHQQQEQQVKDCWLTSLWPTHSYPPCACQAPAAVQSRLRDAQLPALTVPHLSTHTHCLSSRPLRINIHSAVPPHCPPTLQVVS